MQKLQQFIIVIFLLVPQIALAQFPTPYLTNNLIDRFYNDESFNRDSFLDHKWSLSGSKVSLQIPFKNNSIEVFHLLGSGRKGGAYVGLWNNILVVVKKWNSRSPWDTMAWNREVLAPFKLKEYGFDAAEIYDHSYQDGVILKEYIPGVPLKDFHGVYQNGHITRQELNDAETSWFDFLNDLRNLESKNSYKKWASNNAMHPNINVYDNRETNALYFNGKWVIIDP